MSKYSGKRQPTQLDLLKLRTKAVKAERKRREQLKKQRRKGTNWEEQNNRLPSGPVRPAPRCPKGHVLISAIDACRECIRLDQASVRRGPWAWGR